MGGGGGGDIINLGKPFFNEQFFKNLNFFFFLIVEEENEGAYALKPRMFNSSMDASEKNVFNLLEKINELNFSSFNEECKNRLLTDLKAVTLKNWTHKFYSEVANL